MDAQKIGAGRQGIKGQMRQAGQRSAQRAKETGGQMIQREGQKIKGQNRQDIHTTNDIHVTTSDGTIKVNAYGTLCG